MEFIPCRKEEQSASLQYRLSFMSYSSLNASSFHFDVTRDWARRTSRYNPSFKVIAFILRNVTAYFDARQSVVRKNDCYILLPV